MGIGKDDSKRGPLIVDACEACEACEASKVIRSLFPFLIRILGTFILCLKQSINVHISWDSLAEIGHAAVSLWLTRMAAAGTQSHLLLVLANNAVRTDLSVMAGSLQRASMISLLERLGVMPFRVSSSISSTTVRYETRKKRRIERRGGRETRGMKKQG